LVFLETLVEAAGRTLARDLVQALVDLGGKPLARIGEVAPEGGGAAGP